MNLILIRLKVTNVNELELTTVPAHTQGAGGRCQLVHNLICTRLVPDSVPTAAAATALLLHLPLTLCRFGIMRLDNVGNR